MPDSALIPQVSSAEFASSTASMMADTVCLLVQRPDQVAVKVRTDKDRNVVLLLVSVAPDDIESVIGKEGRTARSLRVVLSSISGKSGIHFELDLQAHPS